MNPTTDTQSANCTWKFRPNRKYLLHLVLFVLLAFMTGGGCIEGCIVTSQATISAWAEQFPRTRPKKHALDVHQGSYGSHFSVTCTSPGPPYPDHVTVKWAPPSGVDTSSVNISHQQYATRFPNGVVWKLPVNQVTGKTDTITMNYDPRIVEGVIVNHFEASSQLYPEPACQNTVFGDILHQFLGGGDGASSGRGSGQIGQAWAPPARGATSPQAADYSVWQVEWDWHGPTDVQMTIDLCQEWKGLLQGGHTFAALRFPVYPPTLAPTDPYTLPVIGGGDYTPTLTLLDESGGWPPTPIISVPLEYKPQYHTFLENELPAAPGEHWLALGVVTTPTIDCDNVPNLDQWGLMTRAWLDFGGGEGTCADCVLPLYYCYEGQTSPALTAALRGVKGWDATSYQGWGITCLGPQPLRLNPTVPTLPFVLEEMHTAWVSPTQTITLRHRILNLSPAPISVTLAHSSTLGLPWGIYSGTWEGPDIPLVPIVDPIRLEALASSGNDRFFWLIADVPAGTPSGAETLVVTAVDATSPGLSAYVSDLVWVGDWVAPPLPSWWHRLYLPLVLRDL